MAGARVRLEQAYLPPGLQPDAAALDRLRQVLQSECGAKGLHVLYAVLVGSRVKGLSHAGSDYDVRVVYTTGGSAAAAPPDNFGHSVGSTALGGGADIQGGRLTATLLPIRCLWFTKSATRRHSHHPLFVYYRTYQSEGVACLVHRRRFVLFPTLHPCRVPSAFPSQRDPWEHFTRPAVGVFCIRRRIASFLPPPQPYSLPGPRGGHSEADTKAESWKKGDSAFEEHHLPLFLFSVSMQQFLIKAANHTLRRGA
eukprot:TRINITY_DN12073_c0_g1_i1.p1 TRINITY_DN12073_c0_g1~~TRINITY_DN12073_c0_g1_i1.p1  ORF type:complete len:254 (+),score=6.79 TRINITY_DN12073_c0_g1_i1:1058-1819(+)